MEELSSFNIFLSGILYSYLPISLFNSVLGQNKNQLWILIAILTVNESF